jgi:hypothetical protein
MSSREKSVPGESRPSVSENAGLTVHSSVQWVQGQVATMHPKLGAMIPAFAVEADVCSAKTSRQMASTAHSYGPPLAAKQSPSLLGALWKTSYSVGISK